MEPVTTFTIREMREIKLALFYAKMAHGTAGHNRLMLIAKMADAFGIEFDFGENEWTLPDGVLVLDDEGEPVSPERV